MAVSKKLQSLMEALQQQGVEPGSDLTAIRQRVADRLTEQTAAATEARLAAAAATARLVYDGRPVDRQGEDIQTRLQGTLMLGEERVAKTSAMLDGLDELARPGSSWTRQVPSAGEQLGMKL